MLDSDWARWASIAVYAGALLIAPAGAETAKDQLEVQPGAAMAAAVSAVSVSVPVMPAQDRLDLSKNYHSAFEDDGELGGVEIRRLRGFKVLLVPGFLSNRYPVYFDDQLAWLRSVRIEAEYVKLNSEASPETNAELIADRVRASKKPVVILSHSKGSLDTWTALTEDPSLIAKANGIKGWISIQGAFLGSPVADFIVDHSLTGPELGSRLWELIGGTRDSLLSLTTQRAADRLSRSKDATEALLDSLPAVAFSSRGPSRSFGLSHQVLARFARWMEPTLSDGLMPVERSRLPGMAFVLAEGVDHADPVMRDPLSSPSEDFDRVRMTKALFSLLLRRMPPASSERRPPQ